MKLVAEKPALRDTLRTVGKRNTIGLVPTMGNLHDGHLSLAREARRQCELVVATVFVNPMQFGPQEDFDRYPRTLDRDAEILEALGVNVLFAPAANEMYPDGQEEQMTVTVGRLGTVLCGASRNGHFDGVATVVAKLFNLVQPHRAYLGEKDWQQLVIVRRMVQQLDMPIEIVGVPTVREPDGLAMSSRNQYLASSQRAIAPLLYGELKHIASNCRANLADTELILEKARARLSKAGFDIDYVEVRDQESLFPATPSSRQTLRVFGAAWLDKTRLIDNVSVG